LRQAAAANCARAATHSGYAASPARPTVAHTGRHLRTSPCRRPLLVVLLVVLALVDAEQPARTPSRTRAALAVQLPELR
jgi:hypothetical protein